MKILFSPSESKNEICPLPSLDEKALIFPNLFGLRMEILKHYEDFIQNSTFEEKQNLFGLKNPKEVAKFSSQNLRQAPAQKAIMLYSGTSYECLNFSSLKKNAKDYIFQNVLIFSNLFGVVRANDALPFYKLKQGQKLGSFSIENFYKKHFSQALDEFLKDDDIIDLRAGFYDKFYTPKQNFSTYKFLKKGKVVSHFAKAYRGILLRILAQNQLKNNTELLNKLPQNLKLKDIEKQGLKQVVILEILD